MSGKYTCNLCNKDFSSKSNLTRHNQTVKSCKGPECPEKRTFSCEFCKKEMGTETHHLQYQKNANEREYIDSFHKDHPANLASICEECHKKIHALGIIYEKRKTSNGYNFISK